MQLFGQVNAVVGPVENKNKVGLNFNNTGMAQDHNINAGSITTGPRFLNLMGHPTTNIEDFWDLMRSYCLGEEWIGTVIVVIGCENEQLLVIG